ncbi:hypothetical protein AADZ91_09110 [Colwelliaceae bacterium 6441]
MLRTQLSQENVKLAAFSRNNRLAYTREKTDSDKQVESYRFLPSSLVKGVWSKLDTEYSNNEHDEKVWDSNILFIPSTFNSQTAKLIEESPTHWSFDMEASIGITVDTEKSDAQEDHNGVFRASVTVKKDPIQIDSFTVYSVGKFAPSLGVKVEKYSSYHELTRLRDKGPLVITSLKETISGSAGFFFSIDEQTTIKNFDFVEHSFSH